MSDEPCVLVGSLGIGPFTWDIVEPFSMLTLIPRDHIDGLLEEIEIKVLVTARGREIKVSVYECLRPCVE